MYLSRALRGVALAAAALGGAGCAPGPSEDCRAYVACADYYAEVSGLSADNLDAYREGGACWTDPAQARACTRACIEGLSGYREALEATGQDAGPCQPPAQSAASTSAES